MRRPHDALRLDIAALAGEGGELSGTWPGPTLDRLAGLQSPPQDMALHDVDWQARGQRLPVTGGESELWLSLRVRSTVWLTCQRCLQPFEVAVPLDRRIRFVRGEAAAEALDAEIEEDVLALSRALDLRALVEDELLLALPLVPRHGVCPQPLPMPVGTEPDPDDAAEPPHPFAALQALKGQGGPAGGSRKG